MPLRAIALACLSLLPCAVAQAQGPRVLALAPANPTPDWPGHLAIELAPVGGQVLRSPLVSGPADEDPALAARVAAQVVGAEAAVWIDPVGRQVHVVLAASRHGFHAPLASSPDARTIALVAASLLEEAFANAEPTGTPLPSEGPPHVELDEPIEPVEQLADRERAPVNHALDPPSETVDVVGFGAIGTGGLAWMSDVSFDPGSVLRGTLGLRVGSSFQFQTNVEIGLVREHVGMESGGLEMQPFGRICPEVAWIIPADSFVGFHLGAHGCVGIAELRYLTFFDPFGTSWDEGPVVTAAGGGYLGLELRPSRGVSVTFRADLDGSAPVESTQFGPISRGPDVIASLSTMVGFW